MSNFHIISYNILIPFRVFVNLVTFHYHFNRKLKAFLNKFFKIFKNFKRENEEISKKYLRIFETKDSSRRKR